MEKQYDVAVVGAGIVGLGHAVAALRRGRSVVVVERATSVVGASIRNFGHIGTSVHLGEAGEHAQRAREVWLRLAAEAGFWLRQAGTLVVARHEDELALLHEAGVGQLLTAAEVAERAPVVGAVGGMLRPDDLQVDPLEAAPAIADWLARQGVEFRWRTSALGASDGTLWTSRGPIKAGAVVFAVNYDVDQLFPSIAEEHGVERCGLDMLLADGVGVSTPLLTGSSMLRYTAFATMPSPAAVRERYQREEPEIFTRDVVVGVLTGARSQEQLTAAGAHHVLKSVTELPELLERLVR